MRNKGTKKERRGYNFKHSIFIHLYPLSITVIYFKFTT